MMSSKGVGELSEMKVVEYFDDSTKSRKRKRAKNPLADARKNDDKLQALWHRKSGAGFRLFAEYYASQPLGVCSDGTATSTTSNNSQLLSLQETSSKSAAQGQGQSRAAKRRKKKKGKPDASSNQHPGNTTQSKEVTSEKPTSEQSNAATNKIDERFLSVLCEYKNDPRGVSSFLQGLSKPLPLTFRIRRTVPHDVQSQLAKQIAQEFGHLVQQKTLLFDSTIYQAVSSTRLSKATLAKTCPQLKDFLVAGSGNGTLARQELASMIPVLGLCHGGYLPNNNNNNKNKKRWKNYRLLDLCASPGSKTLQALELVGPLKKGRVKANDVNASRLQALQAAVERAGLPTTVVNDRSIKYSNLDASQYPIPPKDDDNNDNKSSSKLFDAVIADVPCSGDGTIRKDPHVLANWTPATGNALHALQVQILVRGLHCLKVGGVLSYSTCSLNPVEDEAVVAAALQQVLSSSKSKSRKECDETKTTSNSKSNGIDDEQQHQQQPKVELVPWPTMPGLQHRPGVTDWKIADYVGDTQEEDDDDKVRLTWHATFQDAVTAKMQGARSTMWPLSPDTATKLHLERCIRLWPHDLNDSGGFFVALIRKNW